MRGYFWDEDLKYMDYDVKENCKRVFTKSARTSYEG